MDKNMIQRWIHAIMTLAAIAVLSVSWPGGRVVRPRHPAAREGYVGAPVQRRCSGHGEGGHPCGGPRWWRRAGHDAVLFRQLRTLYYDR